MRAIPVWEHAPEGSAMLVSEGADNGIRLTGGPRPDAFGYNCKLRKNKLFFSDSDYVAVLANE
jgi:hypothetical protein